MGHPLPEVMDDYLSGDSHSLSGFNLHRWSGAPSITTESSMLRDRGDLELELVVTGGIVNRKKRNRLVRDCHYLGIGFQ